MFFTLHNFYILLSLSLSTSIVHGILLVCACFGFKFFFCLFLFFMEFCWFVAVGCFGFKFFCFCFFFFFANFHVFFFFLCCQIYGKEES